MDASLLHDQIAAVCPIDGISIGDPEDKATWRVDYAGTATDPQKEAALSVLASFDQNSAPVRQVRKSTIIARLTNAQLDQALSLMSNRQKERWRAPDHPVVDVDDPELLQVLQAVGADPAVVLAAD